MRCTVVTLDSTPVPGRSVTSRLNRGMSLAVAPARARSPCRSPRCRRPPPTSALHRVQPTVWPARQSVAIGSRNCQTTLAGRISLARIDLGALRVSLLPHGPLRSPRGRCSPAGVLEDQTGCRQPLGGPSQGPAHRRGSAPARDCLEQDVRRQPPRIRPREPRPDHHATAGDDRRAQAQDGNKSTFPVKVQVAGKTLWIALCYSHFRGRR